MQNYCGGSKCEDLLLEGLDLLNSFEEKYVPLLSANNPHDLMRIHEVLDILTVSKMVIYASLERKSCNTSLSFVRTDYPEINPEKDQHHNVISQKDGKVQVREVPLDYFGNLQEEYEKRNQDYIKEEAIHE